MPKATATTDRPLRLVWVDPKTLNENDLNPRRHPPYQTEVVAELIRKHGWIEPLVANEVTGRLVLLDGHDRRKIAISRGMDVVPVVVGSWPKEQEPEILASLDPSAMLAETDPEALHALMQQLADPAPAVREMIDRLAEDVGVADFLAGAQQEPDFDDGPAPDPVPDAGHQVSFKARGPFHRVVNLELGVEDYAAFVELIDLLAEHHGLPKEPPTVIIMATLRAAGNAAVVELTGTPR